MTKKPKPKPVKLTKAEAVTLEWWSLTDEVVGDMYHDLQRRGLLGRNEPTPAGLAALGRSDRRRLVAHGRGVVGRAPTLQVSPRHVRSPGTSIAIIPPPRAFFPGEEGRRVPAMMAFLREAR